MTTDALSRTPIYDEHVKAKGRIVPFAGWEMPVQYTGIVDEHQAVRNAAGLFDVCHMGELEMRGQYAAQVVDYLVTGDVTKMKDGQAMILPTPNGAQVIVLAGAPLAGLARTLRGRLPVPCVDGVSSAVRHAESLVALQPGAARAGSFAPPPVKPHRGLPPAIARLLDRKP